MAIYHFEAKIISRGIGRSAIAASAYMSCSRLYNEYDGIEHDYTRKRGLVYQEVMLPLQASAEWADREKLWNAVEEAEQAKDSRLAREFVAALPVELSKEEWISLLRNYIQNSFVSAGMCADFSIHDTDGHNPHAHIILTMRPLDENGKWQKKTEKEYLCIREGEEKGFTASEFKMIQNAGWEKQYQYKVGKKKVYMPTSAAEAQGYERISKYPKSTKYGRQNPITEQWNSEEQLIKWREAWADAVNQVLEEKGLGDRVDHRSFKERGIREQPTIHEGVPSRFMKTSDRHRLNQQIKNDNQELHILKEEYEKVLAESKKISIPELARKIENLFMQLLINRYNQIQAEKALKWYSDWLKDMKPEYQKYKSIKNEIKAKRSYLLDLKKEQKIISKLNITKQMELSRKITTLTEDITELKSGLSTLLLYYPSETEFTEAGTKIPSFEEKMKKQQIIRDTLQKKFSVQTKELLSLKEKVSPDEIVILKTEREKIHQGSVEQARKALKNVYKNKFDHKQFSDTENYILNSLDEVNKNISIKQSLQLAKGMSNSTNISNSKGKKPETFR